MEETTPAVEVESTTSASPDAPQNISVAGAQPEIASDREGDQLKITLGEFEGPLDLLLYLIRQDQVNIYDIPVARITDEYLRYLYLMQELDLTVAGDFLVMAAQLIDLKSRMLLPRDPTAAEEEVLDPRAELVNRLLEHEKFKAAAQMLWSRATVEQAVFTARGDRNRQEQSGSGRRPLRFAQGVSGDSRSPQGRSPDGDRAGRSDYGPDD
jgi:segregation and condensation protein A